ncbi:uncharacterized protein Tco025E_00216 [Trypanosoma conorhini]|uniref:Uncharacterized protein n=1 Tax=Trypanosoma conorhini TaxID=83891 RepID=A0A422QCE6_9TRYP|nr:uncharacterized protein Tco025E_00216 [Trypanosoma conorhini]RNF27566.1 hypothetical protein Tco025E_00216 [Trypanosoma conorhini]
MNTRPENAAVVPQPSKRATRYSAEMVKLLWIMDRTPSSNWASLSTSLSQLLKCIESNIEAAAEVVPDPSLLCRVIWKCFDPQGVMGVHRKTLDVLQRLCLCAGTSMLIQRMPLLLVGVLELLPQCSIQVKGELLNFVEVYMLRTLPPAVVAVELPGILSGVLGGLEESDTSDVYRSTLQIMETIHAMLNSASIVTPLTSSESGEIGRNHHEQGTLLEDSVAGSGDRHVYAALWLTLKNCPSLRGCVLLYMKLRLSGEAPHAHTGNRGALAVEGADGTVEQQRHSGVVASVAPSVVLAGDLRVAHSAIFATLQEPSERKHRLMLDVLIGAVPLGDQASFTFSERSLLVAAVIQLLGFPDVSISIRRRIAAWLTGPVPEAASAYVQDVSSFLVAQAFRRVVRWWESQFLPTEVQDTRTHADPVSPLEESYYRVLFTSACKHCLSPLDPAAAATTHIDLREACVMPTVWLRALVGLFRHIFAPDGVNNGDDDDNDAINTNNGGFYCGDCPSCAGVCDDDADGPSRATGNPFLEYVAPLVMPFVCDLLASMELWRRERPRQSGSIDPVLNALFAVVTWDYFTRYEHDLVRGLERCLDGLREVPASTAAASGVGEAPEGLGVAEATIKSPSPDAHAKLLLELQTCFRRLGGFATVVGLHVMALVDQDLERTAAFIHGVFATCQSLCGVVQGACETLLAHGTTGDDTVRFSLAQVLINGSLDAFNFIFFGVFSALQDRMELTGKGAVFRGREAALLDAMMRGAVAMAQLVLRGGDGCAETLTRLNDTAFSLLQLSLQSGSQPSSSDSLSGLCTEMLERWVDAVASVASSTCLAVQQHAFRLYVDLLNSVAPPQALPGAICMQELMLRLLPRLWEFLGTCSTEMQPQVVELLVRLYATKECRDILDELTSVATTENGERLLLLFRLLEEENVAESLFRPGFFMMLCALDDKDASLRRLSQSIVRQSIPCLDRVLNPLIDRLAQYFMPRGTAEEVAVAEQANCTASLPSSHLLQEQATKCLGPMEFIRLVKAVLTVPSFLSLFLGRLHAMQPPAGSRALMAAVLPSPSEDRSGEEREVEMPLDSSFAVLAGLLLGIVRRSLRSQCGGTGGDSPRLRVELCTEACEALNLMLEGTLSLPDVSETIVRTWHCTSLHMLDLLRVVVRRSPFAGVQVLMLRHFLDAVRLLDALDPTATTFPRDPSACVLAKAPPQVGASATVADEAERVSSHNCILALKLQKFYDTASDGVERAAAAALTSGWAVDDLLSMWCGALLELLPFFHEQRDEALGRLLHVFIRVIDELRLQPASPTGSAAARVVEKCLMSIYGILKFHLAAERQTLQCHAAGKRVPVGWFAAHVPILSGGGGPSAAQKAAGSDAAPYEAVRRSIRPVLSTLCKLHCSGHQARLAAGAAGGERQSGGAYDRVPASHAESGIHRVLRLYAQELGAEFYKAYIEVWAARHARPWETLFTPSKPTPSETAGRHSLQGARNRRSQLSPFTVSGGDAASPAPSSLSDPELLAQLLNTATGIAALPLVHVVEELLVKQRSTATNTSAASSRHHALGAEMPFDAVAFCFLHTFLCACRVPPGDAQEVLSALIGVATLHLSQGSPSLVCLPLIVQVLAHFVLGHSLLQSPASSSLCGSDEAGRVEWGRDKRCAQIICKVLDALCTAASHTAPPQAELLFAFRVLAVSLPALACSALLDQDRIANAVLSFYKRSLLPSIMFGVDAQTDAETRARTPLVKAALSVLQVIVKFGDAISRRLRQELLDALCTCDFFRFPQSVVHEWGVIFEWLSQDRTFHGDAVQLLAPASSHSSRIVALIQSAEEEERQRVRQAKRLVFYVTCVPPATLMLDREFCLLLRECIAENLRAFHSAASGSAVSKSGSGYRSVRHALFLFRVLLTKLDPALLHPFWPIVLPGVLRALSLPSPAGDAAPAAATARAPDGELLALQMECLKLLDFLVVIMPGTFAPFRWVFFDDLDAAATLAPSAATAAFTPLVHHLAPPPRPRAVSLHDVWAPAVFSSDAFAVWGGYQRPLLRFPPVCYSKLPGIGACAGALSLFSYSAGLLTTAGTHEQTSSSLVASTRLIDGWDEAYVRALVEADFSCVLEENVFASPSC